MARLGSGKGRIRNNCYSIAVIRPPARVRFRTAIQNVLDDRIISPGLWPAKSLRLNACDFYLWGTLQSKVYANNPHSLEKLKQNIRYEIGDISENELRRVIGHVFRRCEA